MSAFSVPKWFLQAEGHLPRFLTCRQDLHRVFLMIFWLLLMDAHFMSRFIKQRVSFYEPQTSCARCVCGVTYYICQCKFQQSRFGTLYIHCWCSFEFAKRKKYPIRQQKVAVGILQPGPSLSLCTYNLLLNRIRNWSCSYPYRALINMEWVFF